MEARQKAAEKMKKLSRTKTDSVESNSMEGEKKICERSELQIQNDPLKGGNFDSMKRGDFDSIKRNK